MSKPVLYLTGASGNFGKVFLDKAASSGLYDKYEVRSGTSSPNKIQELSAKYPQIKWNVCNLENESDLDSSFSGVDTLYIIPGGVENRGELAAKAVRHAKKQNVRKVLLFSVVGAEYKSILFARQFRLAEEELENSGMIWNHIRTIWFHENIFGWVGAIKQGTFPIATGEGKFATMNLGDAADASLALLMKNDNSWDNKAWVITGPELLSSGEVAEIMSKSLGREIKFISPTPEEQLSGLLAVGWPEWQAKGVLELLDLFKNNLASFVSPDFKTLTGKEGTKFADFFEQVKGAFQP